MRPEDRVLALLARTADPWAVAGAARIPFAALVPLLRSLEDRGLVRLGRGRASLTPAGRRRAARTAWADRLPAGLPARLRRLARGRPEPSDRYDQGHLTLRSVVARVRTMTAWGDLYPGVRVAVLGDDDLASLALALTGLPARVAVFEIDPRLVAFLEARASSEGLPVEVHRFDLRRPLPPDHIGAYDVFVCDPSETDAGLRMFVGRGLSCLRPGAGGAGYFGLTLIEADYEKWRRLERWITARPVVVSAILPDHGVYENWPTQRREAVAWGLEAFDAPAPAGWYRSALFRVETLEGFHPPRPGAVRGDPIADQQYFASRIGRR